MAKGLFTAVNPELELAFDDIATRRPLPLGVLEALDGQQMMIQRARAVGMHREALTTQVKAEYYQRAFDLYRQVNDEAEDFAHHARVRQAVADKLESDVAPKVVHERGSGAMVEYLTLAHKLRYARQFGRYGVDSTSAWLYEGERDEPWRAEYEWTNRAGLVKLCPSDARWEGNRVGRLYGERLKVLDELGFVLRYAVFTLPNFPQWHLASGLHAIKKLFYKKLFYARTDGKIARSWRDKKRVFPNLVGALCTIEAPLSGIYDRDPSNAWHVHLNVLMVFKPDAERPHGWPDYGALREAWGAHVHFEEIPQGSRDATAAALKELCKYPVRAVSEKSAEQRKPKYDHEGNELPSAPPLIEWPWQYVDEWWQAHKGFRRTWSCGQLYDDELEALDGADVTVYQAPKRNTSQFEYFGGIWVSTAGADVSPPRLDTRERDAHRRREQKWHEMRMSSDDAYAAAYLERQRNAELRAEHRARRREARDVLLTFIQGNKFANADGTHVGEGFRARAGPPITAS